MCDAGVVGMCNTLLGKLVVAAWFASAEVLTGSAHLGKDKDQASYLL